MNTDQIAAEAATKIWAECGEQSDYLDTKQMKDIIQAAIEKAYQDGYVEGSNYQISISRAAQASEPKNFTKSGNPLPVLRCPYCGCKSLHEDALTMCCQRAISKTLRAAHASEDTKRLEILICPHCGCKSTDPESLTLCCTKAIRLAIEAHKIKAEDTAA